MSKYKLPSGSKFSGESTLDEVDTFLVRVGSDRITDYDPKADNYLRARWALRALGKHAEQTGATDEPIEQIAGDLLSNLQHLFDALGMDVTVAELADAKSYHYAAEIDGVL